jgi:formate dehydrogenase major subunit
VSPTFQLPLWTTADAHRLQTKDCHGRLSRPRDFLKAAGTFTGTALGGVACLGASLAPTLAQAQELRIKKATATPSVCPYCSVGCATLVHRVEGKIVNIEGDPRSPHNEGTLCPKGAGI